MKNSLWIVLGLTLLAGTSRADIVTVPENLSQVRAFPNPWRVDRHTGHPMTFDQFPPSAVATVRIFTISGELVRALSGSGSVQWDMRNGSGQNVASGVYLYLLTANNQQKTGKVVVIR